MVDSLESIINQPLIFNLITSSQPPLYICIYIKYSTVAFFLLHCWQLHEIATLNYYYHLIPY